MARIFYIDDALDNEGSMSPNLEQTTLNFLKAKLKGSEVLGFGTLHEVFHYFYDFNNPLPDLFILDHNLYWGKDGDRHFSDCYHQGYQFRFSYQVIQELQSIRGKILETPKVIYSDSTTAEMYFRISDVPYIKFIPKWNHNPWEKLTEEVELLLSSPRPLEYRG